jgi:ElaA protein
VRISAQQRLEVFYHSLGFDTASDPYDEDGISHVEMLRSAVAKPASP